MKFVAVLLALVVPAGAYFMTIAQQEEEAMQRVDEQIHDLDVHIEMARAAQRKYQQFHEETSKLDGEIEKLRRILPPELDVDGIHTTLEQAAIDNAVHLTRFEPGSAKNDQLEISCELLGGPKPTAEFFRRLINTARVYHITSITMRPDAMGWRTGFVLTAFAMSDAPEAPVVSSRSAARDSVRSRS